MRSGKTERLAADADGIARAAALLLDGRRVAFPTETVYGLGADARNATAVAGIFEAKGRPSFNPLIVHVASLTQAQEIAEIGGDAARLAEAFWPGPLTLVLPRKAGSGIAGIATAGLETVALRVPEMELAQDLLTAFGGPVAAPSANPSGRVSATTADHVIDGLEGRIAAVLDGGPCPVGLESTIVGFVDGKAVLLRPGGVPVEAIEACLGYALTTPATDPDAPTSPGQLLSHYAPNARLRLGAVAAEPGEFMIGFGSVPGDVTLSASGDLTEAAARLFELLRMLDDDHITAAAVAPIPQTGLGLAINDRLRRAAAPRD